MDVGIAGIEWVRLFSFHKCPTSMAYMLFLKALMDARGPFVNMTLAN